VNKYVSRETLNTCILLKTLLLFIRATNIM